MQIDYRYCFFRLLCGLVVYVGWALSAFAATPYPPPTGQNSVARDGTVTLRPNTDGTTTAHVTAQLVNVPYTVTSTSQQVDDDSLDLLIVFRVDGDYPAQTYQSDINLGVLPSLVKRVRFLTQSAGAPIVQQAETLLADRCLTFGPAFQATPTEYETLRIPIAVSSAASPARVLRVARYANGIDIYVDTKLPTDICPSDSAPTMQNLEVLIPGLGTRFVTIRLLHYTGKVAAAAMLTMTGTSPRISVRSLEFRERGSYFLTANPSDVTTLLGLVGPTQNQVWTSADEGFSAWAANGIAPATATPVCRFFNAAASTHFYSARSEDCAALRARSDWVDEGVAFRILLPQNGACGEATLPVYRLFSQALANHRYTTSVSTYLALSTAGWNGEGIAFCSPTGY